MKKKTPSSPNNLKSKISTAQSLRVLIVEDSEDDALLEIRELKKGGYDPVYERVETATAMKKALKEKQWDIILCDYKLPKINASLAIALLKETNIYIPLIVVSGAIGEETAIECMRLGAHDYIIKNNLSGLCPAIARELKEVEVRNKQRQAKEIILQSEKRFKTLYQGSPISTFTWQKKEDDFFLIDYNRAAILLTEDRASNYMGKSALKLYRKRPEIIDDMLRCFKEQSTINRELVSQHFAPSKVLSVYYSYIPPDLIIVHMEDITERKRAEEALRLSKEKYRNILESIQEGYFELDLAGNYTFVNEANCKFLGYTKEEMIGMNYRQHTDEENAKKLYQPYRQLYQTGKPIEILEVESIRKDGTKVTYETSVSLIKNSESKPIGYRAISRDITKRKKMEEALRDSEKRFRELSIVDELTQLYNSRHFYFQLKIELDRANRYQQPLTLLLLDLDNFKAFNDAYGHVEGDQVLRRLGQVLKRCIRNTDFAYRYGGEEFTILLPMTTSSDGTVIAERIRAELKNESFSPEAGKDVHMTVSIGLAQFKLHEDMKDFVRRVDQLMYQAKKNGKDRVCSES